MVGKKNKLGHAILVPHQLKLPCPNILGFGEDDLHKLHELFLAWRNLSRLNDLIAAGSPGAFAAAIAGG